MNANRLVIAGGSGFLGRLLTEHYAALGWEVVVLTRSRESRSGMVRHVHWDGETAGAWVRELENSKALINLCGVSVDCRYHARNRRRILQSRLKPTRVLGEAVASCRRPPEVWLNSSTATIYKHTYGRPWDEAGEIGATPEAKDAFSIEVACAWEKVFNEATVSRTRKVLLRSAVVLGSGSNSALPVLRRLVRLGLGGSIAGGGQYFSWIHEQDFCRAVAWLIEHPVEGVFNVASPAPVTNRHFMRALRDCCKRRFGLPATRWMLEIGAFFLRTESELVLKSRNVVPGRLLASGFEFEFPEIRVALRDLEGRPALP